MCTCLRLLRHCLRMRMRLHLHVFAPIHLPPRTVVPAPACLHAWVSSLYFSFFILVLTASPHCLRHRPALAVPIPQWATSVCATATKCSLSRPWPRPPAAPAPWPTFPPLAVPAAFVPWRIFLPLATRICRACTMAHLPAGCAHLLHLCHGASFCPWPPPAMPAPLSHLWLHPPVLALLSHLCPPTFVHLPHPCCNQPGVIVQPIVPL